VKIEHVPSRDIPLPAAKGSVVLLVLSLILKYHERRFVRHPTLLFALPNHSVDFLLRTVWPQHVGPQPHRSH
jgi:hypothetical protein